MTVMFNAGYEDGIDLTSYVTVRHKRYSHELVPRRTEIAAYDRNAYGGRQPATNAAALLDIDRNKKLRCSDCRKDKPLEAFPKLSGCWHRRERGYQCSDCKHIRYEHAKQMAQHLTFEAQQSEKRLSKKQRKQAQKKLDKQVA